MFYATCTACGDLTRTYQFEISAQAVADYHVWKNPSHICGVLGADDEGPVNSRPLSGLSEAS